MSLYLLWVHVMQRFVLLWWLILFDTIQPHLSRLSAISVSLLSKLLVWICAWSWHTAWRHPFGRVGQWLAWLRVFRPVQNSSRDKGKVLYLWWSWSQQPFSTDIFLVSYWCCTFLSMRLLDGNALLWGCSRIRTTQPFVNHSGWFSSKNTWQISVSLWHIGGLQRTHKFCILTWISKWIFWTSLHHIPLCVDNIPWTTLQQDVTRTTPQGPTLASDMFTTVFNPCEVVFISKWTSRSEVSQHPALSLSFFLGCFYKTLRRQKET